MKIIPIYKEYIQSNEWAEKSRDFIQEIKSCENCGSTEDLECHHLDYDNLGHETRKDIQVLCKSCHGDTHNFDKLIKNNSLSDEEENPEEYIRKIIGGCNNVGQNSESVPQLRWQGNLANQTRAQKKLGFIPDSVDF